MPDTNLSYCQPGLVLGRARTGASAGQIFDLQHDLRCLGYMGAGIDGKFGAATERAVKALQYDLLNNHGRGRSTDGNAPVSIVDYTHTRVLAVTGEVDQGLSACISDMLKDEKFVKLPQAQNPAAENHTVAATIASLPSTDAPTPFLMAILKQESNLMHFNEPRGNDKDTFIVVGLDTNSTEKHIITSRGYGIGQYTLFHHPPQRQEVDDFMIDASRNVKKAISELREKFDNFVNGSTSGTRADDRQAEVGNCPPRICNFSIGDPRFMKDCRNCAQQAGLQDIKEGITPLYPGSNNKFQATQYYKSGSYQGVPIRKNIPCDWLYAVRRYNGAGMDSYHYQARVLRNLIE